MDRIKLIVVRYLTIGCVCKVIFASWPMPFPPGFPIPPGAAPVWPPMMRPPQGGPQMPFGRHAHHPPHGHPPPLAFPASALAALGSFAPIGFEYPTEEEFFAMEREKKRQQRIRAEKTRAILTAIKRNQESEFKTTTTPESILSSKEKDIQMDSYNPKQSEAYDNSINRDSHHNKFSDHRKINDNSFVKFDDSKSSLKSSQSTVPTPESSEDTFKSSQSTIGTSSEVANSGQRSMMPPDPANKPVDIKRKKVSSPNGSVTYITEMIYDVEGGNPFKPTSTPPVLPPSFLPPPNDAMYPPTDDPRLSRNSHTTTYLPPGSLARPDDDWTIQLPTPPIPYKGHRPYDERMNGYTRQNSRVSGNSQSRSVGGGPGNNLSKNSHYSPSANSPNRRMNENNSPGLGAAAIAGIVIGSLVSVALLAGTALFVMYKSPFGDKRRKRGDNHPHHHHPPPPPPPPHGSSAYSRPSHLPVRQISRSSYTESTSASSSNPHTDGRVYRWPPRRCQNMHHQPSQKQSSARNLHS